jgi:hypothetical protein
VCEQVIVEEGTQNLTPVNSFRRRIVQQFPPEPLGFVVFAILNDGVGEIRLDLAISRLDTYEKVYQRSMPVRFENQLQEGRCLFRIRDCSFPVPGAYEVAIFADSELIAQRRILITQKESTS